jgi:hypothetical protein
VRLGAGCDHAGVAAPPAASADDRGDARPAGTAAAPSSDDRGAARRAGIAASSSDDRGAARRAGIAAGLRGARARPPAPGETREPARLLPDWLARLGAFVPLAALGVVEWQRMVDGRGAGRGLLWVLVATLVAAGVVATGGRRSARAVLLRAVAVAGGAVALCAAAGLSLGTLRPSRWPALLDGLFGGSRALGTVRLPYAGADPWPAVVLELLGAALCLLAAVLAVWPRGSGRARGFPFLALAALLVLVAAPVVSLGGTGTLLLGLVLAGLTVAFLWLERLPLRPGVGVAALLGLALAGALPLATMADRGQPWFDYRAFAEALGPQDPIRFDFDHSEYGPITWPRDGAEVLRVKSDQPAYWKVRTLSDFDGLGWEEGGASGPLGLGPEADLPEDWGNRPGWTSRIEVSIRRMRTSEIVGAGTVVSVSHATRPLRPGGQPGSWLADSELSSGDSYDALVHVPRPSGDELARATAGQRGRQKQDLVLDLPFTRPPTDVPLAPNGSPVRSVEMHFPAYGQRAGLLAAYPALMRSVPGAPAERALEQTYYARAWHLARRLRRGTQTPFQYLLKVNAHLQKGFSYTEAPPPVPAGRAPLDAFLFDGRAGYCQHFAGAMALLLRMGGVPARVATGFSPGGFAKRRDAWIVRDTDAHAWVEAWFDAYGWVTVDPTPVATPARSQIAALQAPREPTPSGAGAASTAARRARAGDGRAGSGLRGDLRFDRQRDTPVDGGGNAHDGGEPSAAVAAVLVALSGALLAAARALRRRRGAGRARGDGPERAIAELEAALRRAGRPAPTGTTLRQLEARLGGSPDAVAYLRALRSARYAASAPTPTGAQRRALRRELAAGLGLTGRLRALWALPPRLR